MASVNSVTLIGNATKDAEVKVLSNGQPVANFGLATTDRWVDRDSGQQKEATEFHNITAFRKLAELAERFVSKGSQLYIEGHLKTRSWEKDGVKHYRTEVEATKILALGKKETANPLKADKSYHSDRSSYDKPPF